MKDYRQVFRFCVIKGTASVGSAPDDWRITEGEEAFQSRERAHKAFDQAQEALIPIARLRGTKLRKEDGILWFVEESSGPPLVHYLRYEEIPLEKQKEPLKEDEEDLSGFRMPPFEQSLSPAEERVLETGTCFLGENARIENRKVRPSPPGEDEYAAEGSPKDRRHPMRFTRRRSTATYSKIRLTLERARSTVFFGEMYPDQLEDELRRRAVKLESPRKLFTTVRKAFEQGVRSCSLLIDSDWLRMEYADWQHSLGWEPGNEYLPDELTDYLNFQFLKQAGFLDERMTIRRYRSLRERMDRQMYDGDVPEAGQLLPEPVVSVDELMGAREEDFPLLLTVWFGISDAHDEKVEKAERTYEEISGAYHAFVRHERIE